MSRTTSAVDIEPDSGLPVVEHALPNCLAAPTYFCSSALPHGNATFMLLSTAVWSLTVLKHLTLVLLAIPRGSTPTMSNRSRSDLLRKFGAYSAMSTPDPPGPPG